MVAETPFECLAGPFDLVLANLTAETLLDLAPTLAERIGSPGDALLSGLLDSDAERIGARYEAAGLALVEVAAEGEWRALYLERR